MDLYYIPSITQGQVNNHFAIILNYILKFMARFHFENHQVFLFIFSLETYLSSLNWLIKYTQYFY